MTGHNPAIRLLLPFIAILAAGMLSAAFTGDFEWLYPFRFVSATSTFVVLWRRYRDLNWRFTWVAPVAGISVFLIWTSLDRAAPADSEAMPAALSAASPLARSLWLIIRVLSAVVIVPFAEELAFRGFLYRRLLSSDFESVSFHRFSLLALVISSVAFGILHG